MLGGINVILALMVILAFLISIPLHEFGHAVAATMLGDDTPRSEGRQSLSWRVHIDPVGMLLCIILAFQPVAYLIGGSLLSGPVGLGWGQPVKPDPWKMRVGPNVGSFLVACAGLLFSLILGIIAAIILRFLPGIWMENVFAVRLFQFIMVFSSVNISLALFNIIPLYPLDGYQILYSVLPSHQALQFARSAPYGVFIILALFFLAPFLGQLVGLGGFPLFQIPHYILLGALDIVSSIAGFNVTPLYLP
jgi:Zn-dependent protease